MTNNKSRPAASRSRRTAAEVLSQLEMWGLKLGLDRIQATLSALGRPDQEYGVVLVAGTNGKGTTAATLASMLSASGYRTGLFTSPHLESVRERIRVDGRAISERQLLTCVERVVDAAAQRAEDPLPSYFEAVTAAALVHFADQSVELAVLEVGLGGRLDATNATEPMLSIITSIGHDHQEHLGHRLDQIAREKAGIARIGRPLVAWAPKQGTVQAVLSDLDRKGVEVDEAWRHLAFDVGASDRYLGRHSVTIRSHGALTGNASSADETRQYTACMPNAAAHQLSNTALAARAAEHLRLMGFRRISSASVTEGIESCRWPGRLETVDLGLRDGPQQVLLDGAHNPAGARALAQFLAELEAADAQRTPWNLVFGSVQGKSATAALAELAAYVDRIWITAPTNSRALSADALERKLRRYRPGLAQRCTAIAQCSEALDTAVQNTQHNLLVCGSLYLVGEARTWLFQRYGKPSPAADISLFS